MVSYALGAPELSKEQCLNPCCDGRWSRTLTADEQLLQRTHVLILVVMEDGLVRVANHFNNVGEYSLNPCCDGRWSRTRITY